jgi:hypothetical protein
MTISITSPTANTRFSPGQSVTFQGENGPATGYAISAPGQGPQDLSWIQVSGGMGSQWSLTVTVSTTAGSYVFNVKNADGRIASLPFSVSSGGGSGPGHP